MLSFSERQKEIIRFVVENKKEYVQVSKISEFLNISEKTIYRELKLIREFEFVDLETKTGKGIKINLNSKSFLKNCIVSIKNKNTISRQLKIYYDLLINSPYNTNILELSQKYYVSHTSIISDIKYIQNNLLFKNLQLIKDKKGTRIIGKEIDVRNAINLLLKKYNLIESNENSKRNRKLIFELQQKFGKEKVNIVEEIIKKIEVRLNYDFGDIYYINLCTHLLILIERAQKGLLDNSFQEYKVANENKYNIACKISKELEQKLNIVLNNQEIFNIYKYLESFGRSVKIQENTLNPIILDFISRIEKILKISFLTNEKIYELLIIHLSSLINRINYGIQIENPEYEYLIVHLKNVVESLKNLIQKLPLNNPLSKIIDSELAYIAVYCQAIIENNINENKNIVIVCPSGFGTSELLKNRILNKFSNINNVVIMSLRELYKSNLDNFDFIISTVKIDKIDKMVVNVSILLDEEDVVKLNKVINGV